MLNNLKRILIMNKIKILTVLSMMFGLLIMSVPVYSFAATRQIPLQKTNGYNAQYFPDTGYVCTYDFRGGKFLIGKYVLPKKLNKTTLGKLKGSFPGVFMVGQERYDNKVRKNYVKIYDNIVINKTGGYKINNTVYDAEAENYDAAYEYCNRTKFDVQFQERRKGFLNGGFLP